MKKYKLLALILSAAMVFTLLSACNIAEKAPAEPKLSTSAEPVSSAPVQPAEPAAATDYKDVYNALNLSRQPETGVYSDGLAMNEAVATEAAAPMAAAEDTAFAAEAGVGGGDYSQTNVQVDGIDEADVVKTDGEYIYILRDAEIIIAKADGADTEVISTIIIAENNDSIYEDDYSKGENKWPSNMYISDGRLAIMSSYNSWEEYTDEDGNWVYNNDDYAVIDFYDVSDPYAPGLISSLGQDGYELTSRLMDGKLYFITTYSVWDWDVDDPYSYVPCLYEAGEAILPDPGGIIIMPNPAETFTVIAEYDLASGSVNDSLEILGGSGTAYMSGENLYLAATRYEENQSEPRQESVYTVVDFENRQVTDISKISLSPLSVEATATVSGGLNNQFSMDEYDGYLRLVTTVGGDNYTTYTDEEFDFVNYKWGDYASTNCLFVLDSFLNTVSSLEGLAEDEYIYSARFDGEIAYFCTYRNVDPLFAVDLSDPANPTILSELKITGFSEYLHVWDDGLLFGLGQEADEETGMTDGLKLVMFDTANKADVFAADEYLLDESWSEALYNHKAALVSLARNIIAFPCDSGYYIFGYDDSGFFEKAVVQLDDWYYNARGLYIGDYIYIVSSEQIIVLDMENYDIILELNPPRG